MNTLLLAPLALVLAGIAAGSLVARAIGPRNAAGVLTLFCGFAALTTVAALVQVTFAGLSEVAVVADAIGWCRALYGGGHGATPVVGLVAGAVLGGVAIGAIRYARKVRSEMAAFAGINGLEIVEIDGPVAFTVPGRPGGVVIGTGLLRSLDADARSALIAHENAHLMFHHHRYVRFTELCAAGLPFLKPLARQVRFMTERWADEVAADRVGSRQLVAETIARVALMSNSSPVGLALGFGGRGGATARVDALMNPTSGSRGIGLLGSTTMIMIVVLGAGLQVHHLARFLAHVCGTGA